MMVHTWRKYPPWLVQRLWWYCTIAKKRCKCTWAEKSESAGSYWGEILGGIMTQLILRAAATGYKGKIPRVGADCNNMGVVTHGNTPHIPLSARIRLTFHYQQTQHRLISSTSSKTSFRFNPSPLSTNLFDPTRTIQRSGKIVLWKNKLTSE